MYGIPVEGVETPCTIVDLGALEANLQILADVQARAGCKILLALKGFATWKTFPLVGQYLSGIAASSPHEARLGREELGKEVHAYAPAYDEPSFREICELSDHVVFNSFSQLERLLPIARAAGRKIELGMRVNPEHSEVKIPIYDPCAPKSRLGVRSSEFRDDLVSELSGLHFHTLCELGVEPLERTLSVVEQKFGKYFSRLRWVNFGGGHHITKPNYDRDGLVKLIQGFRARTGLDVYLEPGEAIAIGTGVLVASVLDIVENHGPVAILDTSATAHMPDTLEMPYRPEIVGAQMPGELPHTYRLGGLTCLAGDVIGDYSFEKPLQIGDKLTFLDMGHYTTVKTTTFNGVRLPSLATYDPKSGRVEIFRRFGYEDFKNRLS